MTTKESFQENYPFMTCIKCNDTEYLGIIINFDQQVTSLYDFAVINNSGYQKLFLELIDDSYQLVFNSLSKKTRNELTLG